MKNIDELRKELNIKEESIDFFFECAVDLLCIANTDGFFLKLSSQWERTLGYKIEELENRKFFDFIHPDDIESTLAVVEELKGQKKVIDFVNRYKAKDGSYKLLEWRTAPSGNLIYAAARDITEKRQVEESLKEAVEVINYMPSGLITFQFERPDRFFVVDANTSALKLFDSSIPKIKGLELAELSPIININFVRNKCLDVIKTGNSLIFEDKIDIDSNSSLFYRIIAFNMPLARLGVIFDDITPQKKAQIELQESEAKFRSLFENMTEGVALHEIIYNEQNSAVNYRILDVNKAFQLHTGVKPERAKGELATIVYGVSEPPFLSLYENVARTGEPFTFETYVPSLKKHFIISVVSPKKGYFATVFEDITNRKINEEKINTLNEELQIINFELENKFAQRTSELTKTMELLKSSNSELQLLNKKGAEDREKITKLNEELIKSQEELKILNRQLEDRVIERTMELVSLKDKAEESDRKKSAFLANMSHEIRTPMNGIIGFSNMLADPELSDSEKSEYIAILNKSCFRLLNIINDIIDISKIEAGKMTVSEINFDLNNLMREIEQFFKPNAEHKGLSLILELALEDASSSIYSDEQKIHQILSNLINNALKFTHYGSITFGYKIKNDLIEFYVSDTGIGIPQNSVEEIFDRFKREELSSSKYEGTGLGLSIAKGLAELLGGKIWVESTEGKGSTFYFTIPYLIKTPKTKVLQKPDISRQAKEMLKDSLILVVEDEDMNFSYLKKVIEKETNAQIIRATDGYEAIDYCRNNQDIKCVLMDIKLPNLNGLAAISEIRKFKPVLPIIAVTAYALTEDRDSAILAGADDYLAKPFKPIDLINKMINLLREIKNFS
jgi:PAS domain S-box-containing protein